MGGSSSRLTKEEKKMMKELDEATKHSRKNLTAQYKEFKKQHGSAITRPAFRDLVEDFFPPERLTDDYLDRLFNAFDLDHDGTIDFSEFMLSLEMASSDDPKDKLRFCFRSLDTDNSGYLDGEELLYAVRILFAHIPNLIDRVPEDLNTPEKVVQQIFEKVDENGDGEISEEELIHLMETDDYTFQYLGLNLIFLN